MYMLFPFFRRAISKKIHPLCALLLMGFCCVVNAATYNLSTGVYPPCVGGSGWSVIGSTYICGGNGRVTLASGDIITASANVTIYADNGFSLSGNTIGSSGARINLSSNYGTVTSSGTNVVNGNINAGSGVVTLVNSTVNGTLTTTGNINLTGGGVTGLVTSSSNTITTNGTNLSGGATAQSGMSITGGTIAGSFAMTAFNAATFSGVTMTGGSISGASTVTIQSGSVLGSASSSINISSSSGAITVNNSTVYGSLTAPFYSTVNVTNGASVYGTCSPNSTPANACGAVPLPPTPMNCSAGVASGITGNYFNNRTLTEPSTASRSDAPIDFNWGAAAPGASGINADNFSVRWTGYIRATQTGAYRFQTVSDDGVRLYINGTLVIDRWNDHSSTTDTTGDFNLVAGNTYSITLEYFEGTGDAVIRLQWRLPGASSFVAIPGGPLPTMGAGLYECMPVATPPVSSCATTLSAGITGNYFNNQTLTNPVTSRRLDGPINFDWGTGVPGPTGIGVDGFSVRWDGYVRVTQSGMHRFQTTSDDGIRLTVNGVLLIDQWNDHSSTTHTSAAVNLVAGNSYPIKLEYYENSGSAIAQLRWQTPGSTSYVAIPIGVNASPISAPGLYECVATPASYSFTHNATGITCAAEAVTVTARNAAGNAYNPPAGTEVTLSTDPATGVWVGGTNPFVFSGNESSFTRYLQQTTPGSLTIRAASATVTSTSLMPITFVDTALRIALNPALANIPIQVAGVNGNAIAKVISTNPKTGVCEAKVASKTLPVGLGFTCNNPTSCVNLQTFTVNSSSITANNNAAAVTYNNVNLVFNANGEAPMTINYSDVGQVTLHGRLKIDAVGNDPEIILSASSNPFIVKPYTLRVVNVAQATSPYLTNLGTTSSGNGFLVAGEKFSVTVRSYNAVGATTPNFGNEGNSLATSERNKIQLQMGCPERSVERNRTNVCPGVKPDYPIGGRAGTLTIGEDANLDSIIDYPAATSAGGVFPVVWNEVGSFRLEPSLKSGYLDTLDTLGVIDRITPSGIIGRFYPDRFHLTAPSITNSCGADFSYMEHPSIRVAFNVSALNISGSVVQNYDNKTLGFITANIDHVLKDLSAVLDANADISNRFAIGNTAEWNGGNLGFNSSTAMFKRARNIANTSIVVDGPFNNSLELGVKLVSVDPVKQSMNLNASKKGGCTGDCNAHSLGVFNSMRFGRLRMDSAFGSGAADLPVTLMTEYWTGSLWAKNINDSCTAISRNNILYGVSETPITNSNNLNVSLNGGSTTGSYGLIDPIYVKFGAGDASHKFSAPGGAVEDSFPVRVNLASYPWLTFDWNQSGGIPVVEQCNPLTPPDSSDCSLRAVYSFGNYRGHDRIIYWRERFN